MFEERKKKTKKYTAEDKMDRLIELVTEMKEDSKSSRKEVSGLKEQVVEMKTEVEGIKTTVERDTKLTAEMREDIDGLENENLRTIVIVRKLKAEKTVPKEKKALRTYVQDLSRDLVAKVIGKKEAVKYAAMLYAFVDPSKKDNKEGLVPPSQKGRGSNLS